MPKKELNEVYLLRGLASLMVCLFHLILGNEDFLPSTNFLEKAFSFGYLGVEVFFILSGYVICYSLPKGFGYADLKTFFLKRLARIEPPYLISIAVVIVLNYLSNKITGIESESINIYYLSLHLAYLNNFFSNTYLNVVYWTLGIEFQFYIIIGGLFPIIASSLPKTIIALLLFMALACLPVPQSISVILPYFSFFGIGILLFSFKLENLVRLPTFLIVFTGFIIQIYFYQGIAATVASVATAMVILFWKYSNGVIRFFSMISFSLYLIHVPIGGKVINLGARYVTSDVTKYLLVLLAFGTSIFAAYLFYRVVEKPSFTFAKSFKYKNVRRKNGNEYSPSSDSTKSGNQPKTVVVQEST